MTKNFVLTGIRSSYRPLRSESLYRLRFSGPWKKHRCLLGICSDKKILKILCTLISFRFRSIRCSVFPWGVVSLWNSVCCLKLNFTQQNSTHSQQHHVWILFERFTAPLKWLPNFGRSSSAHTRDFCCISEQEGRHKHVMVNRVRVSGLCH
jgi:hypothetical protein